MTKTIKICLALAFLASGGALASPVLAVEGDGDGEGAGCEWAERMVMGVCDGATTSLCKGSEQDCKKAPPSEA